MRIHYTSSIINVVVTCVCHKLLPPLLLLDRPLVTVRTSARRTVTQESNQTSPKTTTPPPTMITTHPLSCNSFGQSPYRRRAVVTTSARPTCSQRRSSKRSIVARRAIVRVSSRLLRRQNHARLPHISANMSVPHRYTWLWQCLLCEQQWSDAITASSSSLSRID
jgi:hypothetical protein